VNLQRLRYHAQQLLVALDALDKQAGRIDQQILDLLSSTEDGLSTNGITSILRRRRDTVRTTLRLMEQAHQITRNSARRWVLGD
jgi:hypothetical protein